MRELAIEQAHAAAHVMVHGKPQSNIVAMIMAKRPEGPTMKEIEKIIPD